MSLIKSQTKSKSIVWSLDLRPKVNDTVIWNNSVYVNATGVNTEPGTQNNWVLVFNNSRPVVIVFGNRFLLLKHPDNSDPLKISEIETNDFICDGYRDNSTLWIKAQCLSTSDINNVDSWSLKDSLDVLTSFEFLGVQSINGYIEVSGLSSQFTSLQFGELGYLFSDLKIFNNTNRDEFITDVLPDGDIEVSGITAGELQSNNTGTGLSFIIFS